MLWVKLVLTSSTAMSYSVTLPVLVTVMMYSTVSPTLWPAFTCAVFSTLMEASAVMVVTISVS